MAQPSQDIQMTSGTISGSQTKKGVLLGEVTISAPSADEELSTTVGPYRLYKRRWVGVFALFALEAVSSASWPWFGPISNNVSRDFGFTLDEVNWLGNVIACVYLPTAFLTPMITKRYGLKRSCNIATFVLLLSAWVRYAGTARSLPKGGAYALIIIGQALSAISQPVYQILAPKYSERWFNLKGRTTATMIISIANPIGGALGQLLSPLFSDTRKSILVLAIISTVVVPIDLLILEAPPTPPSYSGSRQVSPSIFSLIRAATGLKCPPEVYMTLRERFDFAILVFVFSTLLAGINTFSILSSQWLSPYGYSDNTSGLMGAALLLSGILAAIATSPIFDRILTHHLGITVRILCPIIGAAWLSLIWAARPHNDGALFAVFVIIGICSVVLLPVAIELGVELTRNSDGSSAVLWFFGNLISIIFILSQNALRASDAANPPRNMHRAIIFNAIWVFSTSLLVFFLHGRQARRELDERMNEEQKMQGQIQGGSKLQSPLSPEPAKA
ncbi:MFS general substrate transporter [Multifurca ochricompacta]|uniref:MFS general substrate transporter n=1 Tax=Multifurca ochricompacta TaxID=376703 RepID=A0AAD4LYR8_9AGAM|nr:MFS general substrate transporter [Multifurca ochricompacta]